MLWSGLLCGPGFVTGCQGCPTMGGPLAMHSLMDKSVRNSLEVVVPFISRALLVACSKEKITWIALMDIVMVNEQKLLSK